MKYLLPLSILLGIVYANPFPQTEGVGGEGSSPAPTEPSSPGSSEPEVTIIPRQESPTTLVSVIPRQEYTTVRVSVIPRQESTGAGGVSLTSKQHIVGRELRLQ